MLSRPFLGTQSHHSRFRGSFSQKTPIFGPFLANRSDSWVLRSNCDTDQTC